MRKFKRMIVCVMTAVMTISCMPGVSVLAGESETTMAEELAVENNSVARAVASYYFYNEPTGANYRTAGSFRVRC